MNKLNLILLILATAPSAFAATPICKEIARSDGYSADVCAVANATPGSVKLSEITFNELPLVNKRSYAKTLCKLFAAGSLTGFTSVLAQQTIDMNNLTQVHFGTMMPAEGPALETVNCNP
jgi:hypothetical protein